MLWLGVLAGGVGMLHGVLLFRRAEEVPQNGFYVLLHILHVLLFMGLSVLCFTRWL